MALALLIFTLPALARPRTAEADRQKHLDAVGVHLDAGEWKEAKERIRKAEKEILERSRPERGDERALSRLALYKAVTEANLGHQDAAEWYWYASYLLHQPTAYSDVSQWGEAEELLGEIEVRDLGREPEGVETFRNYAGIEFDEPSIPQTRAPGSLTDTYALKNSKPIQVEVYLAPDGRPQKPRLLGALPQPMLLYSWLTQAFEERWKPARHEGEAVGMMVTVTQAPTDDRR